MDRLWYIGDGEVNGPCPDLQIRRMLQEGRIAPGGWVWAPGLAGWTRARDLPDMRPALKFVADLTPDPAGPDLPLPDPARPQRAGVLARYLAQFIDQGMTAVAVHLLLLLIGRWWIFPELQGLPWIAIAMAVVPLSLFWQALCLARFGTTPGKALLDIRVCDGRGGRPGLAAILRRQTDLWMRGFVLGVPVLSFVGTVLAGAKVFEGRRAPWDAANGLEVLRGCQGLGPVVVAVLLNVLFGFTASFLLSEIPQHP